MASSKLLIVMSKTEGLVFHFQQYLVCIKFFFLLLFSSAHLWWQVTLKSVMCQQNVAWQWSMVYRLSAWTTSGTACRQAKGSLSTAIRLVERAKLLISALEKSLVGLIYLIQTLSKMPGWTCRYRDVNFQQLHGVSWSLNSEFSETSVLLYLSTAKKPPL